MRLLTASGTGVCDRIALALFGYAISSAVGRSFELYWPLNGRCGCRFERLFNTDLFPVLSDCPNYPEPRQVLKNLGSLENARHRVAVAQAPILEIAGYHGHNFDEVDAVFSPSKEVAELVESFRSKVFRRRMVGVHVRRGDKMHYHPAPIAQFIEAAAVEARRIDGGVFLSTDDPSIREHFKEAFEGRYCSYPLRSTSRNCTDGIIDAVASLYLLKGCDAVIGSTFSGFSLMAGWHSKFTNIPSEQSMNTDWQGNPLNSIGKGQV